jgi:cold shock CspA family protein
MSSQEATTPSETTETRYNARVKWFNNKAGYGFLTITDECDHKDIDVFAHHTSIKTEKEQYKYLVQGEYVSFDLNKMDSGDHEYQAGNVKGFADGKLMCETRNEIRSQRLADGNNRRGPRDSQDGGVPPRRVNVRGPGPRGGEEWMLVRRRGGYNNRQRAPRRDPEPQAPSVEE